MAYYIQQHKFFDDRLTVFKKKASHNWYGRCWIDGKAKEVSSKTRNFTKAKSFLQEWYRGLTYKLNNDLPVHDLQFNKLFKQYNDFRKKRKKTQYSKNISTTFNAVLKGYFHNRKINSISKKVITNYIAYRVKKFKKDNKKEIAYATLVQDLMMISGFMNWCFEQGHREKKIAISKTWISEVVGTKKIKDTSRTYFTISEYDKLLKTSRQRIKSSEKGDTLYRREYLHQFIIFMVHSGVRPGEAYNLRWKDVKFIDKGIKQNNKKHCELNVTGKTGTRECYTYFGSYFALKKIMQLKEIKSLQPTIVANSKVFNQRFRRGLNDLLEAANLKTSSFGDRTLTRDSKSFRSTYISWAVIRGDNVRAIADNCGTSPKVIQDFYTKYIELKNFKKQLTQISNVERLHQNGQ